MVADMINKAKIMIPLIITCLITVSSCDKQVAELKQKKDELTKELVQKKDTLVKTADDKWNQAKGYLSSDKSKPSSS